MGRSGRLIDDVDLLVAALITISAAIGAASRTNVDKAAIGVIVVGLVAFSIDVVAVAAAFVDIVLLLPHLLTMLLLLTIVT